MNVKTKLKKKTFSINDCNNGDVVILDDGYDNFWYALVGSNEDGERYEEKYFVDIEDGSLYRDVENYNILKIYNGKDVIVELGD